VKSPVSLSFLAELLTEGDQEVFGFLNPGSLYSESDEKELFAHRLYITTLNILGLKIVYGRMLAFLVTVSSYKGGLRSWAFIIFAFFGVSFISVIDTMLFDGKLSDVEVIGYLGIIIYILMLSIILMALFVFIFRIERRLQLWNHICVRLEIPDNVLHKVVGTHYLPWNRGQPFKYLLTDKERSGVFDIQDEDSNKEIKSDSAT